MCAPHPRRGHGKAGLASRLLLALVLSALIAAPLSAQTVPQEAEAAGTTPGASDALRRELDQTRAENQVLNAQLDEAKAQLARLRSDRDALHGRVTEMGGRLKQAEQARTEIETRLQAAALETERLKGELERQLQHGQAEGARLSSENQDLRMQLDTTRKEVAELRSLRDGLGRRMRELESGFQRLEQASAEAKQRLSATALEAKRLEQDLAHSIEANRALEQRLAAMEHTLGEREREIASIRGRLPASEGGSVTAEQAKTAAATAAQGLRTALQDAAGHRDPASRHAVREAANRLHHSQFLVARTVGARSIYRVRPGDTLAVVSQRFYGDANRWSRIFEANEHVLEDPDRLIPGMTLVIP
jgi:chromosome segregation ATPase